MQGRPTSPLLGYFDDTAKAVDGIEERLAFIVDQAELGAAVCESVELLHRVQGLTARIAAAASRNNVESDNGQRTMGQFVAARTNAEGAVVNRLMRSVRWLRDFPILEAAFGAQLTDAHVRHLRKHCDATFDAHQRLLIDQQYFVDQAIALTFEDFKHACAYWLAHWDPDGKEPVDQIDKTSLSLRKGRGGRLEVKGQVDALRGQALETAVNHRADQLRIEDMRNGAERTDSQRRMAALVELACRGAARDDGTHPVPLINLVMSQKVAEWTQGVLGGTIAPGDTVPVSFDDVDGRCELIDGKPVHPFLAAMVLGHYGFDTVGQPKLRRHVMDATSRVIDVSVNARNFPDWMRTASLIESRGRCTTAGCEAPHHWIQTDHVHPVAAGGPTQLQNAQAMCRPDNQAKAATVGHLRWQDRRPPPRHRPRARGAATADPDDLASTRRQTF